MFGSDWPVCNVGGPAGEEGNWGVWVQVVEGLLDGLGCGEVTRESVSSRCTNQEMAMVGV